MKAEIRCFITTQSLRVKLILFQDTVPQSMKPYKSSQYQNLGSGVSVHPWVAAGSTLVSSLELATRKPQLCRGLVKQAHIEPLQQR